MWKILCLALLLVKSSIQTEYEPASVALGATPTVQKVPDLTGLDVFYQCKSTGSNNKGCPGFEYYFPVTGIYGYDSSDFSQYVNKEVANDIGYILALCPNVKHDTSKIAYRYSVYCGRLMYAQARWCKENDVKMRSNPQLSLCKKTCVEFANSIVDYGKSVCGNDANSNALAEKIKDNIIKKWCSIFSDDAGCIEGTTNEVQNCGFSSASISKEAQQFNPSNSCWKIEGKLEQIQKQATEESNKVVKMGAIKWKIIYPIIVMAIIGAITFVFWSRQNKLYKIGYVPEAKKDDDYEIIPSNVEPSREYLDQDFIKNEIEFPESTLQRKSSFAVSTISKTSRATAAPASNVVYMVAIYNYHAKMDDELELKAGDRIRVEHQYDDGWAAGINETTNKFGAFPLVCCSNNISTNQGALPTRNKSSRLKNRNNSVRTTQSAKTIGSSPLAKNDKQP